MVAKALQEGLQRKKLKLNNRVATGMLMSVPKTNPMEDLQSIFTIMSEHDIKPDRVFVKVLQRHLGNHFHNEEGHMLINDMLVSCGSSHILTPGGITDAAAYIKQKADLREYKHNRYLKAMEHKRREKEERKGELHAAQLRGILEELDAFELK